MLADLSGGTFPKVDGGRGVFWPSRKIVSTPVVVAGPVVGPVAGTVFAVGVGGRYRKGPGQACFKEVRIPGGDWVPGEAGG